MRCLTSPYYMPSGRGRMAPAPPAPIMDTYSETAFCTKMELYTLLAPVVLQVNEWHDQQISDVNAHRASLRGLAVTRGGDLAYIGATCYMYLHYEEYCCQWFCCRQSTCCCQFTVSLLCRGDTSVSRYYLPYSFIQDANAKFGCVVRLGATMLVYSGNEGVVCA